MDHDRSDRELFDRISAAFEHDLPPIPDDLTRAARDAFQWRRADVVLAELTFDSASDELVGVRGATSNRRSFRFTAGDAVVRVHLTEATMIVMLEPPLEVECRVATGGDAAVAVSEHLTDEYGELAIDAPEFPVRVEIDLPDGTVVTPWITA